MRRWIAAISMLTLAMLLAFGALVVPSAGTASAQTPPKPTTVSPTQKKQTVQEKRAKVTQAQREAAAARAAAQGLKVPSIMAAGPTAAAAAMQDPMSAPYYFSVPNYANSPLPVLTGTATAVGNPLIERQYATDATTPPGQVLVVLPTPLPEGFLQSFKTFNMATGGVSTPLSAGNMFHAYILRPTPVANEYSVIFDTGTLTVLPLADPAVSEVATFQVGNVAVKAGDVIAFYGQGIPLDLTGSDLVSYPAPASPLAGTNIALGSAGYPMIASRTYSFGATVLPAGASGAGGLRKFIDTLPGLYVSGQTALADADNNLGQYIPVAVPDTTSFPGSDYYEIELGQYQEKMHTDLPPTTLRGYRQTNTNDPNVSKFHYLGPAIAATKDRPVRIKFTNKLPTDVGGNLFLPVDVTVMGSGMGPNMGGMAEADPQNPMCGMPGVKDPNCFSENRATLHLHGGISPWISDGTPHQWITPAGESTAYPEGVSVRNVPDMPDPGDGSQTFFYTNQQSARLMFYHDHAWGITRLNVYAGEAAPYIITDATEKKLLPATAENPTGLGVIPGPEATIPLVVQDKTFVPSDAQLATTDPLWNTARWGGMGNLWMPHVYVPAQNPGDASGVNQFGRWAYGPWFWPPTTGVEFGPIDNPYYNSACNPDDPAFPLGQWCEPPLMPGTPFNSMGMEAFHDTPLVNGTVYPTTTVEPKTYRLRVLNAANDRFFNLSLYQADATGTEVALNAAEVAAAFAGDTTVFPTPDEALGPKGPTWIQIGTEGGFLPAPVEIPAQPITWVNDPTVFNAGNVDQHSLLLGPAERADVIVDFSAFAGKTLILYNDAPAAFPARDARYDYYTGNADLRDTGGAPTTLPGYGPNTRTVMQIKVAAAAPAPAFSLSTLQAAFAHKTDGTGVFESGQHPIIVGQGEYNSAYGTSFATSGARNGTAQIFDGWLDFDTLAIDPATGQRRTLRLDFQWKAIQDEMGEAFDHEYGRMSGNLGLEVPNTQAGVQQNLILLPYVNPATEVLNGIELPVGATAQQLAATTGADGVQIWKITHNGVDTHPIHFHLFDVQVLNRVGWDGIIRKPDKNELGWKDTLRISPLEDTIVALRPIVPKSPFGLPDSQRPLNPMMPIGSTAMFNNTGPDAQPINPPITNQVVNFGWEYVWHCHILSHEEMDMMRPISVDVSRQLPVPPVVTLTAPGQLSWTDGTPITPGEGITASWGNPGGEIGYRIERAVIGNNGKPGAYAAIGTALANTTIYTDSSAVAGTSYAYRVVAFNAAGESTSAAVGGPAETTPSAPNNLIATVKAGPQVALAWRDRSNNEAYFVVERSVDSGATWVPIGSAPANSQAFADAAVASGNTYQYRVRAVNGGGASAPSNTVTAALIAAPAAPSNLAGTVVRQGNKATVTLSWTDNSAPPVAETGFTIERATNATFSVGLTTTTVAANTVTTTQSGLFRGVTYYFRIRADNSGGGSAWSNVVAIVTP